MNNLVFISCGQCGSISTPDRTRVTFNGTTKVYVGSGCKACKNPGPMSHVWRLVTSVNMYLNMKTVEYKKGEPQCG